MSGRSRTLVILSVLIGMSGSAHAVNPTYQGRMCLWNGTTCAGGFATASYPTHHYVVDRINRVYAPPAGGPLRNQLLVYLHGCCSPAASDPTASGDVADNGFVTQAVAAGYHVVSLDFNNTAENVWGDLANPDGLGGRAGCGCDPHCRGYYFRYLWTGQWHNGLGLGTHMPIEESIEERLRSVLLWLLTHAAAHSSGPNDTPAAWGQYLTTCGPGCYDGPVYSKIAMTGFSLGSDITGYVAKQVRLARAVLLVGIGDSLDFDPPIGSHEYYDIKSNWDTTLAPVPSCVKQLNPPMTSAWVRDNSWTGGPNATVWKTPLTSIYSLRGKCDTTAVSPDLAPALIQPYEPYYRSTLFNWNVITLGSLHVGTGPCALDGYGDIQNFSAPWCGRHGLSLGELLPSGVCDTAASLCGGGHASVVGADTGTPACSSTPDYAKLISAWKYMLTN
jgi:hypothetical protein